jgi:hypothetical protein
MERRTPKKLFRRRRRSTVVVLAVVAAVAVAGAGVAAWTLTRPGGTESRASSSPSSSPTVARSRSPSVLGTPKIHGVVVQVLNGTTRRRLAATYTSRVAKAGYETIVPGNTTPRRTTLIAYQSGFGPDADLIRRLYLQGAVLQEAVVAFPSGADITVLIGRDATG